MLADPRYDCRLSLDQLRGIDRRCVEFESALAANHAATTEQLLAGYTGDERRALLRELLAIEIEQRAAKGEAVPEQDYLARFADDRSIVELALAEWKKSLDDVQANRNSEHDRSIPDFLKSHPRYRVLRLVGRGGMGAVYLARHVALDREVALKIIRPELLATPDAADWFRREARAIAKLSHPQIVAVFDADEIAGQQTLVMEYVRGADLRLTVREQGPLRVAEACRIVAQVAGALQYAFERGIVHRDISPRNLMLTESNEVKVLDFGLSRLGQDARNEELSGKQNTRGLIGSPDYMAPEQAADPDGADIRSDIYSLGCTLHFLLAGRPPFDGQTVAEKLERHRVEPPPRLDHVRPDAPPQLAKILARMMAKDPSQRFSAPADAAAALAPFAGNAESRTIPATKHARPTWAKQLLMAGSLSIAIAAGIAIEAAPRWNTATAAPGVRFDLPEAERLYREGVRLISERKEEQARLAIERFRRVAELCPDSALAQTSLADAYNLCGDYGWQAANDVFPLAESAARRALAIDGASAEAHLALAFVLHSYYCQWDKAEAQYRRAIELNPRLAAAHHWYAWLLADRGKTHEAAEEMALAHQLAPDDLIIVNNVGKLKYLAGDFEGAARQHRYALELDPDFRKAHRDLALALVELGKPDEALAQLQLSRGLTSDDRDALATEAYLLARAGRKDAARERLSQLLPIAEHKPLEYDIATIHAALGATDSAFDWLNRAVERHSAARADLAVDPRLKALHADPRWARLMAALAE